MACIRTVRQECCKQFKFKNFWFSCEDEERELFLRTQYSKSRKIYLAYRIFIWTYQFGWFLAYYIRNAIWDPYQLSIEHRYLTRWGYTVNVAYFTLSLIYCVIRLCCLEDQNNTEGRLECEKERLWLRVLRSIIWMLHSIGQSSALLIVVLYWVFVSASEPGVGSPLDIDVHGINLVLYLLEIFVVAFPMRLLHVIYPVMFGTTYFIATLLMHVSGNVSAVYPALDWANAPGRAVGLGVGVAMLGSVIAHVIMFGLFRLRVYMHENCCSANRSRSKATISPAHVNFTL